MSGAEMFGAWLARTNTGAQPATNSNSDTHNTARRQLPGTASIANVRP